MPSVQHITVTADEAGQKLLQCLQRRVGDSIPRSLVMRWIRKGEVRVNKRRAKPFDRVEQDDIIRIPPYTSPQPSNTADRNQSSEAVYGPLDILAKEHGLLVINKPAGLPVQPGSGHTDNIASRLKAQFASADFIPSPAHRLDKATSGLLLAGTSYASLRHLHELFRDEHAIRKEYLVWVHGVWPENSPLQLLDTMEKQRTGDTEKVQTGTGKHASCTVQPVLRKTNTTLLAVTLHTGRTHQIRVQLSSRGYPVIGDRKYGGPKCRQGMLLHSWRMTLPLPDATDRNVQHSCLPHWTGPWTVDDSVLAESSLPYDHQKY